MKKIWNEFKEFAVKGNAVDLAVGVIVGAAFTGIINKLRKPAEEKEPDKKDCPACAMKIPIKAARCPYCTTELSEAAAR